MGDAIAKRVETITYYPDVQGGTDLEGATKVITATAEASGTGNADYSSALTLAIPTDARLVMKRVAARLTFTIDSFDVATILYCRVYVDAQDADHRLIDTSHNAASQKIDGANSTSGTIFSLLTDGAEHTFYFFFWVNQATSATISEVTLWEGVGHYGGLASQIEGLSLNYTGWVQLPAVLTSARVGSGSRSETFTINPGVGLQNYTEYDIVGLVATGPRAFLMNGVHAIGCWSSVATDLSYMRRVVYILSPR